MKLTNLKCCASSSGGLLFADRLQT